MPRGQVVVGVEGDGDVVVGVAGVPGGEAGFGEFEAEQEPAMQPREA